MTDRTASRLDKAAAISLMAGALLMVIFMLHHPSTSADGLGAALAEIRDEGALSAWVHGMLILVIIGIWFGAYGLARELGFDQPLPVLGFMLFGLGTAAYCLAAMVSGFIVPWIGAGYAGAAPDLMEQARGLLRVSGATNQAFANAGLIGTSAGILCWSIGLVRRASWARLVGALGLLVGLLPALLLLTGHLRLHVTGMTLVAVADSGWYLLAGAWLLWGRHGGAH